jgi:hypothetical protein
MKIVGVILFGVVAAIAVALRWYQLKDSLSNYLRSKPKTGEDRSQIEKRSD